MIFQVAHFPAFAVAVTSRGRGKLTMLGLAGSAEQLLPTDPLGLTTVRLTNVVVGSRYRVEVDSTGALIAEGVAAASTVELTVSYYGSGSLNNNIRVKVRKGTSAPKYQPFQTLATLSAAAVTVYVAQVPDSIA